MHVTIFSTGGKFHLVSIFTYLHALSLVARSYALLIIFKVLFIALANVNRDPIDGFHGAWLSKNVVYAPNVFSNR